MNRTIALFVALVILLAHCLAIHTDGQGHFAFPYDQAYVPLRLAHDLVHDGQLRWNPGMSAWESYGSPLWIALATVAERVAGSRIGSRLALSVNVLVQAASALCALLTVIFAAQVRGDRAAGLIAPLLLATCGAFAAAAANGIETTLCALLATLSFLAFENRLENRLALATMLLCLARPEGIFFVGVLFLLRYFGFRHGTPRPAAWPFVAPAATIAATTWLRWRATGFLLPPSWNALLHPYPGQMTEGIAWLADAMRTAISLVLVVYALVSLARGRLSGTGARALVLAVVLVAVVVPAGRGTLPFAEALVPALPLAFVATQEGMIESLDGTSVLARRLALTSLFACLFVTAFVSRHPADLGPLRIGAWHERWMRSRGSARFGYEQPLGRLGLEEEIDKTIRLRGVGIFLRDSLEPGASVLTPWPGAVGYLSRLRTFDLLGRASPVPGHARPGAWERRERTDVLAALGMGPDYVVASLEPGGAAPTSSETALAWQRDLDDQPEEPGRLEAIRAAIERYELITVPILYAPRGSTPPTDETILLMRKKDRGERPALRASLANGEIAVTMTHGTFVQIADLRVQAVDALGRTWSCRPTGEWSEHPSAKARAGLLLLDSGSRLTDLFRAKLPESSFGVKFVELRVVLQNPGATDDNTFADVSDRVVVKLLN